MLCLCTEFANCSVIFQATTPQLKSGLAYLFKAHAVKEWTVRKLGRKEEEWAEEREGCHVAMLLYWLPISPDTSASSAVAMGNQAGVSRRVHQRPSLPPNRLSVSPSLCSPRSCMPSSSASKRRSRTWTTSTWGADRSWNKLRTSSPESSSSSESSKRPEERDGRVSRYAGTLQQTQSALTSDAL